MFDCFQAIQFLVFLGYSCIAKLAPAEWQLGEHVYSYIRVDRLLKQSISKETIISAINNVRWHHNNTDTWIFPQIIHLPKAPKISNFRLLKSKVCDVWLCEQKFGQKLLNYNIFSLLSDVLYIMGNSHWEFPKQVKYAAQQKLPCM